MKIEIEIPDPPEGYRTPERKPLYHPFEDVVILTGDCWVLASDVLWHGGSTHICAHKEVTDGLG